MNCSNCHEPLEIGAAFCGNCGQATGAPVEAVATVIPAYALTTVAQQSGEKQALLSVLFGAVGLIGALFVALLGLSLGLAGIIMGTLSRSSRRRELSLAGLALSSLAVLASLAVWVYAIQHDPNLHKNVAQVASTSSAAVSGSGLATPCYSAGLVDTFNITSSANGCDMQAFNGTTLNESTNAYKVYASAAPTVTAANFVAVSKAALEKDLTSSLPGFTMASEQAGSFAGSPAYEVSSFDKLHHVAIIEATVLHPVAAGDNIFVLVHAINGSTADLNILEAQWQWK
jgi:hypothetical protein